MDAPPFDVPGGWVVRDIQLAGKSFSLLLPADPDQLLESQVELLEQGLSSDDESKDPYWASLWSSASPTAEMVLQSTWPANLRALEIGCGLGLVGLAALAGGLQVTFSDFISEAIELAVINAHRNGFPAAAGLQLDWLNPPRLAPERKYAVIFGSDILYNRINHEPILAALDQLLTPDGACWIGDPGRYNSHEFLEIARSQFHVELRDQRHQPLQQPQSGKFQLFVLRR